MPVRIDDRVAGEIPVRRPERGRIHDRRESQRDFQTGQLQHFNMRHANPRPRGRTGATCIMNHMLSAILCFGLSAILFDKEANRSYFRAEGESLDANISVVKIDVTQRPPKLVLKNGLMTATLTFPERTASAAAAPQPNANPAAPGTPGPTTSPTIRRIPFRRGN